MKHLIIVAGMALFALAFPAQAATSASQAAAVAQTCGKAFVRQLPRTSQAYRIGGTLSGTTFSFQLKRNGPEYTLPAPDDDFSIGSFGIAADQGNLVAVVSGSHVEIFGPAPQDFANGVEPEADTGCTLYTRGRLRQ